MGRAWRNVLILVCLPFVVSQHNQCGEPTKYPNRHLDDKYLHKSEFSHGERVEYSCAPGYTKTEGTGITFCKDGLWTPLDLRCGSKSHLKKHDISPARATRGRFPRQTYRTLKVKMCSRPSVVKHGTVIDRKHDQVTVSCRTGYNGSGVHICSNGVWQPKLKCELVKCPVINVINGRTSTNKVWYNTYVDISCRHGFIRHGAQSLHCDVNGSWTPDIPKCEPVFMSAISCSKPAVDHGEITSRLKPYYKHRETVTIKCSEGFDLIGSAKITCRLDGKWQGLMECRPKVKCSAPTMVNGKITSEAKPHYKPQDTVTINCSEGFDLIGSSQITCGPNGQWQALPKCLPQVRCSAPTLVNGKITSEEKPHYRPQDTVIISCSEGFDLIGSSQITCGPNGQWQALPKCDLKVVIEAGKCGPAPYFPLASPREEYIKQNEYTADFRVRYKCNVGYRWSGGRDSIYCKDGKWTELQMTCERRRCGSAGEIFNGHFEYTGVSFGDSATVVCDEGHELIGRAVRHCRDGGWDGRNAECEPVYCPPPPMVNNADIPTYDHVPYGRVVSYHCRTGSLIGSREIYCTKNGTWSSPPPECKDIICPVPSIPHGSAMIGYRSVYRFENAIRIVCNPGYSIADENYVTCGIDGEWIPDPFKLCVSS